MTVLPARLEAMLEHGLGVVKHEGERENLRLVAYPIATAVWQHWLAWRPPEDNRPEHEWVVFANVLEIAEDEFKDIEELETRLSKKRIAAAFAFTHDTFFIPRITEGMLQSLRDEIDSLKTSDPQRAELLEHLLEQRELERPRQRADHMAFGAKNAEFILNRLKGADGESLLTDDEIKGCCRIIANHDGWKLETPTPPPSVDRLAVVCLEADALWPLHPLGVLADLERPEAQDNLFKPSDWRKELESSLKTLRAKYRTKWTGVDETHFQDNESIFRTQRGHRLYREWLDFWKL